MAGHGPLPKETRRRRNESRRDQAAAEVEELREHLAAAPDFGDVSRLKDRTRQWLVSILRSPQAQMYQPSDWQRVKDLLLLKDAFYSLSLEDHSLRLKYAAEIRQQESSLLMAHADRVRAGLKVRPAARSEPEPVEDDPFAGMT
ncbi:hypothetical protein GCM10012275_07940 [Longimycelium tulufanense]|uniref:Uncharacterized protein n=1 Tax=Longimycelium tulufanense TaxID=907463 RepID=A0A8J3FSK1_9PSEU|nr:hypothetical protein [Longimycelium tulufanense]GGM39479.1 hypothetical protein GCM10012275_07940 [Longimycelium tulufanense]